MHIKDVKIKLDIHIKRINDIGSAEPMKRRLQGIYIIINNYSCGNDYYQLLINTIINGFNSYKYHYLIYLNLNIC